MIRRRCVVLLAVVLLITACIPPQAGPSPSPSESSTTPVPATPTPLASSTLTTLDMTAALLAKSLPYANGFELTRTVRGRSGQPPNGFEPVRTTPRSSRGSSRFLDVGLRREENREDEARSVHARNPRSGGSRTTRRRPQSLRTTANSSRERSIRPTGSATAGWSPGGSSRSASTWFRALPARGVGGYFSGSARIRYVTSFSWPSGDVYLNTLARASARGVDRIIARVRAHGAVQPRRRSGSGSTRATRPR